MATMTHQPSSNHHKSTKRKRKVPFAFLFLAWAFPKIEALYPRLAFSWGKKLFFHPIRYKHQEAEQPILRQAKRQTIPYKDERVRIHTWGEGPTVVFIHGWAGRMGQFHQFVPKFVEAGYRVVGIDVIAHGYSSGKRADMVDFANILKAVCEQQGEVEAVVAHSLGGAATMFSLQNGLSAKRAVIIAAPTMHELMMRAFRTRLRASKKLADYIQYKIKKAYGQELKDFFLPSYYQKVQDFSLLIAHDKRDSAVPFQHFQKAQELLPQAEFHVTDGLGHNRILRDEGMIEKVLEFVKRE